MSERAWTPGPWRTNEKLARQVVGILQGDTGQHLAVVAGPKHDGPDEYEANARLIAAAPDLYEALAACLEWIADSNGPFPVEAADAALAKAEGRS